MSIISDPLANSSLLGIPFIPLITDIFFGILGLLIILVFHGSLLNHIIMRFEIKTDSNLKLGQYNRVFMHFYASFFFIALVHITEIILWSFFLLGLGLMKDGVEALLFAGSCYTTVGFQADTLPMGWKSLAFFIAFTGLFSLAWTTSGMFGMTDAYKKAWNLKYGREDLTSS
ncbi:MULTISPECIES: hypothetical protein [unclassified Polynucleobacter]|jgi:hypothetical protein|uniref:hypothetical protein n=1 Tax=unclassified Polynucleobacter TaxID=2640945 RepID=UPI001BFE5AC0|nr:MULTISPECIES: hypothetical protein [unclassified Polynucleobacter]MBU3606457.1 hypothetical protein [Polynucleobacter sp. MWH-Creno-3A4]QWD78602.1 hypothetical protein C2757_03400 [Polynucleobacter sp. MWH-Svant-W18]